MLRLLATTLAVGIGCLAGPTHAEPLHLEYAGNLVQQPRGEEEVSVKRFAIDALLFPTDGGRMLFYLVEEQGGGGWAWPERFGSVLLDEDGSTADEQRPRLLHTFNGTKYPVNVPLPVFPHLERLQEDARWTEGKNVHEVAGTSEIDGRETVRVDVSTNFGRMQSLWIDPDTGLVARVQRRVFMGQGDQFELRMDLKSAEPIAEAALETLRAGVATLTSIQSTLGRDEGETDPTIVVANLDKIAPTVKRLEEETKETALGKFAKTVASDVEAQRKRAGDVTELAKKFVDTDVPETKLVGVDGKPLPEDAWKDRLLLLHFWDYRDEPLEEPYGQVGYVSFLQRKREKLGLGIVGVAVNEELKNPQAASGVKRGVRKLRDFMNLDYPIALDDGTLLKKFGDPRRLGAKLPLWVLVDSSGKIVHYHAGFYDIDPDKGLEELDAIVVEQIRKAREQ